MHIKKYKRNAVGHILLHNEQSFARSKRENVNNSETNKNYNFVSGTGIDNLRKVLNCSDVHVSKRKDLNVVCSLVLTAPQNLPISREREFYKYAFEFFNSRWHCPCISAWVHNDEKKKYINSKTNKVVWSRSHVHYTFVPLVYDKQKEKYKVCAKEVVNKKDLQTLHYDFKKYIDKKMNLDLEIINGATEGVNKTILELKNTTLKRNIKKLEALKKRVQNEIERELCR